MLKLQDFKNRGYDVTRTSVTSKMESDWAYWLIQKCIYGEDTKKYFINVYVADFRITHPELTIPKKRSFTIRLCLERNDLTFWIEIAKHKEFQSIEDIELICEEVWQQLNCDYYKE